MKIISLFAGIGGFDLGFAREGFEIVAHVEKEPTCRKVLHDKWPNAVCLDDVCTAGKWNLPDCDIITFGFPCQDLSTAGKRKGLQGERSGLFFEAMRVIKELRPMYCLFENVPGILNSSSGHDFAAVLDTMAEYGYYGAWRMLDSQWFGVAQRRRRVFGLFARGDIGAGRCAKILSITESLRGSATPGRKIGENVAPCVRGGAPFSRIGDKWAERNALIPCVARTITGNNARGGIPSSDGLDGALIPYKVGQREAVMSVEHESDWLVRRLTPTECLVLQGFPADWLEDYGLADAHKYRMVGNAVTVNVSQWIARKMKAEITGR